MGKDIGKTILREFLGFLLYKIDNDLLTMDEVESMARIIEENLPVYGTVDDIARFYGQSRTNVSSAINRRMIDKPVRRVFYRFDRFRKVVPDKWKSHRQHLDSLHYKRKA